MSVYYIGYDLQNTYIHNWLVAGPQAIPLPNPAPQAGQEFKFETAHRYFEREAGVTYLPVERDILTSGDAELTWNSVHCLDDHFVNLSGFYPTWHYLRAWAYARVVSPASLEVSFVLSTHGPADLWLNGQHIHHQEHFAGQAPQSAVFPVLLQQGYNEILVRFEQVALGQCPYAMALRIVGLPAEAAPETLRVLLPIPDEAVARRQTLERVFQAAYLDRDIFVGNDHITVRWPEDLVPSADVVVRLQRPWGRIYAEAYVAGKAGDQVFLGRPYEIPEGPYQAVLMPRPREYYDQKMRIQRKIDLWVLNRHFSRQPYGTYEERRQEALNHAAQQEDDIFAEIAKMELGRWSKVRTGVIEEAIESIRRRDERDDPHGSARLTAQLLGLLGMLHRYGKNPSFPEQLRGPLEKCILEFRYEMDGPDEDAACLWPQSGQILLYACEILAGQLFPRRRFAGSDQTGKWHRERGEQKAIAWLHKRGIAGFREWDSNCCFELIIAALSHLADLARNRQVWELASVVMDKILFTMALNSYQGGFGSTHGCTSTLMIKSGRLEATAGISRLMWGTGVFNHHIMGTVSLTCAQGYEFLPIIPNIAANRPEEIWNRERHASALEGTPSGDSGLWEINKVTYKTPDYMLCSAQDYRPGERGCREHIWQATLGPDAVVFVTHPPCMSEKESVQPNFWHGNSVLPRVAQWRDVLIAMHRLPVNDWLGFTHAYFPVYAFDEHVLRDGWAFARKGEGYLALIAAQGLELTTRGDNAYCELRSYGQHNVWLCHMGRAAQDGSFNEFQEKVLALDVACEGLSVRCATLRGQSLAFAWEGPLLVDGKEQPITGFKHYENPYCVADWPASQMEIRFGDHLLRLRFGLDR